jgi:sulfite reductase (NADPH) hemoprotein beta-component
VPWQQILVFIDAIVRVYNRFGRRDNAYKARIKILVKSQGERFVEAVQQEFHQILTRDAEGSAHLLTQSEFDRVAAGFGWPSGVVRDLPDEITADVQLPPAGLSSASDATAFARWQERNVRAHRLVGFRAVTLSLKRAGQPPGDASADQLRAAADLAERFSLGELRVSHQQNLVLPWVRATSLPELWRAARAAGFASPNIGLISDLIACPGGDLCALANARTIPVAQALTERFADLDEQHDIGDIDLHMSGCINSCGHHHSGHIGVLGVDKDGREWYQLSIGGSDGSARGGGLAAVGGGAIIGPAFSADELPDAVEAVVDAYRAERLPGERFVDAVRRLGPQPFRRAADAIRRPQAEPEAAVDPVAAAVAA